MRKFIRFCSIAKYLGLLGLPGLFWDLPIFRLFWSFWLFGLIEIFSNLPVFIQSLQQLVGILIIKVRYGSKLPDKDNFRSTIAYSLPFEGSWTVVNGGIDKKASHSWDIPTQRYAYDFIILDNNGSSHSGNSKSASSYYCYGKNILAPADGKVIEVGSKQPDSFLSENGAVDCAAKDIRGNFILICHAESEYSLLAHLQPNSICVKVGDTVKRGQQIAKCGNSGNSSEPHLHFQLQDGVSFSCSAGLPIRFENISTEPSPNYASYDNRPIPVVEQQKSYITRGQCVKNYIKKNL